jgi:hypothetical protein
VTSERRPVETGRTSVKELRPPQAMRGILLGMRGLVRSYVTFAIKLVPIDVKPSGSPSQRIR